MSVDGSTGAESERPAGDAPFQFSLKCLLTAPVVLAMLLGLPACSLAEAADWPRLLGPAGDGKSPETGLRLDWPESGPPVVWRARLGDGHTSPVISGGRLFEFDRWGSKARLTCRNAKTGEALWRSEYESVYKDYYGYNTGPRGSAGDLQQPFHSTSYLAVVGPGTAWPGKTCVKIGDFPDISNTILVVEVVNSGVHWMEPRDLDMDQLTLSVNPPAGRGIAGHKNLGGANVVMADGSVRFLPEDISAHELNALLRTDGRSFAPD